MPAVCRERLNSDTDPSEGIIVALCRLTQKRTNTLITGESYAGFSFSQFLRRDLSQQLEEE